MKISIVVPSLNQARFLGEGVRSVLAQEPGDFSVECIVVDGGSTDGSVEILREIAVSRIPSGCTLQWTSEPDRGQSEAINKGMRRATGDVVAYLNCDDRYAPGTLRRVARAFLDSPAAGWLTGSCRIVDEDGGEIQRGVTVYRDLWLRGYTYTRLRMLNFIAQPATFWRRSSAQREGSFDETRNYTMDYDYWLRLGREGDPLVLEARLADFRIHGASKSGTAYRKQFAEDYETFLRTGPRLPLRAFHRLHNALVVSAYRILK